MKNKNTSRLYEDLADYGYPLAKPLFQSPPEKVLKEMLVQNDVRLLEGFPVVFANVMRGGESFGWEKKDWDFCERFSPKKRLKLAGLLALSDLIFKLYGVGKEMEDRVRKLLRRVDGAESLRKAFETPFAESMPVTVADVELSTERLKNNFRNYFVLAPESREAQNKRRVLEQDLLLSELFTPRQKELLRKRLKGEDFTKTEREYYYRVVKKRLRALADEELHRMARDLLLK